MDITIEIGKNLREIMLAILVAWVVASVLTRG